MKADQNEIQKKKWIVGNASTADPTTTAYRKYAQLQDALVPALRRNLS